MQIAEWKLFDQALGVFKGLVRLAGKSCDDIGPESQAGNLTEQVSHGLNEGVGCITAPHGAKHLGIAALQGKMQMAAKLGMCGHHTGQFAFHGGRLNGTESYAYNRVQRCQGRSQFWKLLPLIAVTGQVAAGEHDFRNPALN